MEFIVKSRNEKDRKVEFETLEGLTGFVVGTESAVMITIDWKKKEFILEIMEEEK